MRARGPGDPPAPRPRSARRGSSAPLPARSAGFAAGAALLRPCADPSAPWGKPMSGHGGGDPAPPVAPAAGVDDGWVVVLEHRRALRAHADVLCHPSRAEVLGMYQRDEARET